MGRAMGISRSYQSQQNQKKCGFVPQQNDSSRPSIEYQTSKNTPFLSDYPGQVGVIGGSGGLCTRPRTPQSLLLVPDNHLFCSVYPIASY